MCVCVCVCRSSVYKNLKERVRITMRLLRGYFILCVVFVVLSCSFVRIEGIGLRKKKASPTVVSRNKGKDNKSVRRACFEGYISFFFVLYDRWWFIRPSLAYSCRIRNEDDGARSLARVHDDSHSLTPPFIHSYVPALFRTHREIHWV